MVGVLKTKPRCFSVSYQNLQTWSVAAQYAVEWRWPDEVIKPLGSILKRRSEAALNTLPHESFVNLLTIRFDGSIEPREPVQIQNVKGKLFRVYPGDVIFSKIDVRNGAIGLAPNDIDSMCATSEFPIYSVETKKAHPEYIKLLFRSAVFKKLLNSMISGASGRKRIQPSQLEGVQVPIPPLSVQHKIVAYWKKAWEAIQNSNETISKIKENSFHKFRIALGISQSMMVRPKMFSTLWSDVDRWGNELVWRKKNNINSFSYPVSPLKKICKTGSGGTPSRKHKEYYGGNIPWVKTTEVKNGIIIDTEEKITEKALASSSAKLYPAGSLVVAMYGQGATRGRTAKLGVDAATNQACLVITEITESLDVDFVWYYLMISYEEMRALASGNNQPNLSADLLGDFLIPIPPKSKQGELKTLFEHALTTSEQIEEEKSELETESKRHIEKLILGTLSVEDL